MSSAMYINIKFDNAPADGEMTTHTKKYVSLIDDLLKLLLKTRVGVYRVDYGGL